MTPFASVVAAALPPALLLPVVPPDGKPGSRLQPGSAGKTPARIEGDTWQPLPDWQNGCDPEWLRHCGGHGANVGLRLGVPADGWQYVALDVDLDAGREAERESCLDAARAFLRDELADTLLARETVPYRAVILCRLPADADAGRKVVWRLGDRTGAAMGKLELLAAGQQVVIAGKHHSGNTIAWRLGGDPDMPADAAPVVDAVPVFLARSAVMDLATAMLDQLARSHGATVLERSASSDSTACGRGVMHLAAPSADAAVALLDALPNPATTDHTTWVRVMLAAVGVIAGLEAVGACTPDQAEAIRDAACRWAAKWPGSDGEAAEIEKWDSDWSTRSAPLAGWQTLRAEAERHGVRGASVTEALDDFAGLTADASCEAETGPWRSMLQLSDKGKALASLSNALTAFTHAPEWRGVVGLDTFGGLPTFYRAPPWADPSRPFQPRAMKDADGTRAAVWLQQRGIMVSSALASEALFAVAEEYQRHPVREFLAGLKWDGVPRIDGWMCDYLGAEDTPFNRAVASRWLISAVARVMRPGCKVDTILILEGRQGLKKSSALAALAGDWFTDNMPDIGTKDCMQQMQGIWLMEMAELDKLGRADANRAKAFISTATDRFRKPYGKLAADYPRQCVFAGTVNPGAVGYLKDETGNRRFWPVACGVGWAERRTVDADGLRAVRGQIWAEALARFQDGAPWWLDSGDYEAAQERVAVARLGEDVWAERIRSFLGDRAETSVAEVLQECLRMAPEKWNDGALVRVGRVLTASGWKRKQVSVGGGRREWRYFSGASGAVVQMHAGSGACTSELAALVQG